MKPSIGRVVIYNHPGSADGKFPQKEAPKNVDQLVEWIKSVPVKLRTFITNDGESMVVSISGRRG